MVTKETVKAFVKVLEDAGYEYPLPLIEDILIPKAIKEGTSLHTAMYKHAESGLDSSCVELRMAINEISISGLNKLDIHEVLTEKPS